MAKILLSNFSAQGIDAADKNGKSDPYLKITYGANKPVKTAVLSETLSPVWRDEFTLPFSPTAFVVKIEVFDRDIGRFDEYLGEVNASLDDAVASPGTPVRKTYTISNKSRSAGDLTFTVVFSGGPSVTGAAAGGSGSAVATMLAAAAAATLEPTPPLPPAGECRAR